MYQQRGLSTFFQVLRYLFINQRKAHRRIIAGVICLFLLVGGYFVLRPHSESVGGAADSCSLTGGTWKAWVQYYDHIETIDFSSTSGSYFLGYGQSPRFEGTFSIRRLSSNTVELSNWTGDLRGSPRTVTYSIEEGDYRFVRENPWGRDDHLRFRCKLTTRPYPTPVYDEFYDDPYEHEHSFYGREVR